MNHVTSSIAAPPPDRAAMRVDRSCSGGGLVGWYRFWLSGRCWLSSSPEELLNLGRPQHQRAEHDTDHPLPDRQIGRCQEAVHQAQRNDEEHQQHRPPAHLVHTWPWVHTVSLAPGVALITTTGNSSKDIPPRSHKTITFCPPRITEASHFFILLLAGQKTHSFLAPL